MQGRSAPRYARREQDHEDFSIVGHIHPTTLKHCDFPVIVCFAEILGGRTNWAVALGRMWPLGLACFALELVHRPPDLTAQNADLLACCLPVSLFGRGLKFGG